MLTTVQHNSILNAQGAESRLMSTLEKQSRANQELWREERSGLMKSIERDSGDVAKLEGQFTRSMANTSAKVEVLQKQLADIQESVQLGTEAHAAVEAADGHRRQLLADMSNIKEDIESLSRAVRGAKDGAEETEKRVMRRLTDLEEVTGKGVREALEQCRAVGEKVRILGILNVQLGVCVCEMCLKWT